MAYGGTDNYRVTEQSVTAGGIPQALPFMNQVGTPLGDPTFTKRHKMRVQSSEAFNVINQNGDPAGAFKVPANTVFEFNFNPQVQTDIYATPLSDDADETVTVQVIEES